MKLNRWSRANGKLALMGLAGFCVLLGIGCRGVVSSGSGEDRGKLGIWATDPGISEIDRLEITIVGVDIIPSDAAAEPVRIDLDRPLVLDLTRVGNRNQSGREKIFDNQTLPLGRYREIQLRLDESRLFIEDEGQRFPVTIPPGEEEGLRLPFAATIDDRTNLDLTLDFNADKSLRRLGNNNFEFHPDFRLVRTERTGTLTGLVAESLVRNPTCDNGFNHDEGNRVYVFNGTVNFQDIQGNENDPIATVPVIRSTAGDDFEFTMRFLPQGNYTAVFTCDAKRDDPDPNQDNSVDMFISDQHTFQIEAGQSTSVFFQF